MDRQELIMILKYARDNYPNTRFNDAKNILDSWEAEFGGMQANDLARAVRFHIRNSKTWPTVAHIRKIISRNLYQLIENQEAPALESGQVIEKEIPWEESSCQFCPYLEEGQTKPCDVCRASGGDVYDNSRVIGS